MKIGIISTHSFPNPSTYHGGEVVIIDLIKSLNEMGHEVSFFSPAGSYVPKYGQLYEMPCSYGTLNLSSEHCELFCFNNYVDILKQQNIVHDFSVTKIVADKLFDIGYKNIITTLLGGGWSKTTPPRNLITFSTTQRDRAIRGVSDFENTFTPHMDSGKKYTIMDAHIVYGGIDTDFYYPDYDNKKSFFLWLNRWDPLRGYQFAINLAQQTGIDLIMAGKHPDNIEIQHHKNHAIQAMNMAEGYSNIKFEWLPLDPDHHRAKRDLYQQARAFLYPIQAQEPFGMSQIEVLACGTPVIATNLGAIPEVIDDSKTGYVCENDIKSFISSIVKIDNIKPENCREIAIKRFDRDVMAKAYLREYLSIINGAQW